MNFNDKHIYALFTAQHLLKNRLVKNLIKNGIKITPSHMPILFHLEKNITQTMTDLSKLLNLDNSTITGLIDRLEKMGFVIRDNHPNDRRKYSVSISDNGLKEISKASGVIKKMNMEIESGFSKEEMQAFHRVLASFNKKFL